MPVRQSPSPWVSLYVSHLVCHSVSPFVRPSMRPSISPSVRPFVRPFDHPSFRPQSPRPSDRPSISQSVSQSLSHSDPIHTVSQSFSWSGYSVIELFGQFSVYNWIKWVKILKKLWCFVNAGYKKIHDIVLSGFLTNIVPEIIASPPWLC